MDVGNLVEEPGFHPAFARALTARRKKGNFRSALGVTGVP
jgi:hypothetical protein